jgi:hypothetical protein
VASTSRQVGVTRGVAVNGAIAGGTITGAIGSGFAAATAPGWWLVAVLGAAVPVLGFLTTTLWAEATAAPTDDRFRDPRRAAPAAGEPEFARG